MAKITRKGMEDMLSAYERAAQRISEKAPDSEEERVYRVVSEWLKMVREEVGYIAEGKRP